MKKPTSIISIILIILAVLSLLVALFYWLGYTNTLDGDSHIYILQKTITITALIVAFILLLLAFILFIKHK
ncbi:MAG: hypothetical protein ACI31Q_04245 [Erysipelotrichaceae bacterium]|nr:hypothetical protein [Erysipelotrichaceae bacterium]